MCALNKSNLSSSKVKEFNFLFILGVAPFPGATTGTGGRIRDVQAAGRGAHVVAGTAGYCFGNLHIPGECTKGMTSSSLSWQSSF